MVNSGNVQSDLSSLNHAFNNFSSIVGELGNAWKGNSSSNFVTKSTGFSSDFSSALTGQMNSFSSACDLYASAGSLIDLDTDKLNFDINHPVDIEV